MDDNKKLVRDIDTLMESIKLNAEEITSRPMSQEERTGIIKSSALCMKELSSLVARLAPDKD